MKDGKHKKLSADVCELGFKATLYMGPSDKINLSPQTVPFQQRPATAVYCLPTGMFEAFLAKPMQGSQQ